MHVSKMHEAYGGVCHIFWHLVKEVHWTILPGFGEFHGVFAEMPASMLKI